MNRSWIVLFCCIGLAACLNTTDKNAAAASASTETGQDSANYTSIQWIDSAKDLGTITEGQKLEVSFRFRNSGSKPLVIKGVHASCGCTTPDPPTKPFAPGEEGTIRATFDSKNRVGMNRKEIFVTANTRGVQTHVLSFAVEVKKTAP